MTDDDEPPEPLTPQQQAEEAVLELLAAEADAGAFDFGELVPVTAALAEAIADFRALDPDCWFATATAFTCREADVIAALLRATDQVDTADRFLKEHATDDDGDDDHYDLRGAPDGEA